MKTIKIERRERVAIVVLNRPDALNAVNADMRNELIAAMGELNGDAGIGAIVIVGGGDKAFCSGQDLAEAQGFSAAEVEGWMRHHGAMFQAMRMLDKPLIVAFNGIATGAGFQIG